MKLHLRLDGRSHTLEASRLGIGEGQDDAHIRQMLARYHEVPASALRDLVIDRHPDGVVVRPPAVFG